MDLEQPECVGSTTEASSTETSSAPAVDRAAEFMMKLDAHSHSPVLTVVMIVVNVAVFAAMFLGGVNVDHPTLQSLLDWGANYAPKTSSGHQWWRLVSAMFVHASLLHIGFNMFVLWKIGSFIETLIGNRGFLTAYFCSGIVGGFVSLVWHPYAATVGASGAIFGLYGLLIAILWARDDAIPMEVLSRLTTSTLLFLVYNLVFGLMHQGTDIAAHIGGLLSGFLCGLAMSRPLTFEDSPSSGMRHAAAAAVAALIFVATGFALPRYVDVQAELTALAAVEKKALSVYNAAFTQARMHQLADAQVADRIEQDVLPPWNTERAKLARLTGLPEKQQRVITLIEKYMDTRQQGWTLMATGLRQHNRAVVMQGNSRQMEALQILAQLRTLPR